MLKILTSIFIILFMPTVSLACSCMPVDQTKGYIELLHADVAAASAVVLGKVTSVDMADQQKQVGNNTMKVINGLRRATVEVQNAYKEKITGTINVYTAAKEAACGYPFKPDERHLLFLHEDEEGRYTVNVCGRSRPLDEARRVINPLLDLELLNHLKMLADETGEESEEAAEEKGPTSEEEAFDS